jgi:hypothetical protein
VPLRDKMAAVTRSGISRREWLLASAAALSCGRTKPTGFPGYCFVANLEGRSLGVVDLTQFRPLKPVPLDAAPTSVIAHPAGSKVFALAPEAGTVYEVDAASFSISRHARVGNLAVAMQLSPERQSLWVLSHDPAALVELPIDTLRPARHIRLNTPPDTFQLSGDGRAAIASRETRSIVLASLSAGVVERTIASGHEPTLLHWQKDGKRLIVGSRPDRSIGIFHAATGQTVVRLPLPLEPRHFAAKADGGQIFISGDGMDAVVILYPYRTEVSETLLAGRAPAGMAVTDAPPYLLVTNPETDTLTILNFDRMGRKLVAAVQVGQEPRHVVITPDEQYALVLNQKSGDMAVVRLAPLGNQETARRRYPATLFTMVPVGAKPVSAAVVRFG